jgi:hypothetical protein
MISSRLTWMMKGAMCAPFLDEIARPYFKKKKK